METVLPYWPLSCFQGCSDCEGSQYNRARTQRKSGTATDWEARLDGVAGPDRVNAGARTYRSILWQGQEGLGREIRVLELKELDQVLRGLQTAEGKPVCEWKEMKLKGEVRQTGALRVGF